MSARAGLPACGCALGCHLPLGNALEIHPAGARCCLFPRSIPLAEGAPSHAPPPAPDLAANQGLKLTIKNGCSFSHLEM